MRRAFALLAVLSAVTMPALGDSSTDQQILGWSLGERAPEPSDPGGPRSAFGEEVARDMTGLMLVEQPQSRYQIALKDNRRLTLWFDASKTERPVFWIQLSQSYDPLLALPDQYDRIIRNLGEPDYKIDGRQGAPLGALLIKIDPSLSEERRVATKRHIDAVIANRPEPSSSEDPFIEVPDGVHYRLDILGNAFRGKIVAIYTVSNQIDGTDMELIDTAIARDVLSPSQE